MVALAALEAVVKPLISQSVCAFHLFSNGNNGNEMQRRGKSSGENYFSFLCMYIRLLTTSIVFLGVRCLGFRGLYLFALLFISSEYLLEFFLILHLH